MTDTDNKTISLALAIRRGEADVGLGTALAAEMCGLGRLVARVGG